MKTRFEHKHRKEGKLKELYTYHLLLYSLFLHSRSIVAQHELARKFKFNQDLYQWLREGRRRIFYLSVCLKLHINPFLLPRLKLLVHFTMYIVYKWNKLYMTICIGLHPFNSMGSTFFYEQMPFQILTNLRNRLSKWS